MIVLLSACAALLRVRALLLLGLLCVTTLGAQAPTAPELPRATVATTPPAERRVIRVPAGDAAALQAALDSARTGDAIVLPMGAVYRGAFRVTRQTAGAILRADSIAVPPGTRMTPAAAARAPLLEAPPTAEAALLFTDGAAGWHVAGLRFSLAPTSTVNYGLVRLGGGDERALDALPRQIVLDRVLVDGLDIHVTRCVAMQGIAQAVVNSWLANCHGRGQDAQGIVGWGGPGPFLIENNHVEGSGQGIMFGGADPAIPNVVPSDITIRRNHIFKPLAWARGRWTVKAAFELKSARRLLYEGNVIENHWADAQIGFAILLSAANQDGSAPWSTVADVTMRYNVVRNSTGGANLFSRWINVDSASRRVVLTHTLFDRVGVDPITGWAMRQLSILGDWRDLTVTHNTWRSGAPSANAITFDGAPAARVTLARNVFAASEYGWHSSTGSGAAAIAAHAPGADAGGNVVPGVDVGRYPAGTCAEATGPCAGAGADTVAIAAAVAGTFSPPPVVVPPPTPQPPVVVAVSCDDAPAAWVATSATQRRRDDVQLTGTRGCVGVVTLATPTRWAVRWPPCATGQLWRTAPATYTTRASAITRAGRPPACPTSTTDRR